MFFYWSFLLLAGHFQAGFALACSTPSMEEEMTLLAVGQACGGNIRCALDISNSSCHVMEILLTLDFRNTDLVALSLPFVENITSFTVRDNANTTSVSMPRLQRVHGDLNIWENDALQEVLLPELVSVGGNMFVYGNFEVQQVNASRLQRVTGMLQIGGGIDATGSTFSNPSLHTVALPRLSQVGALNIFKVGENPLLSSVFLCWTQIEQCKQIWGLPQKNAPGCLICQAYPGDIRFLSEPIPCDIGCPQGPTVSISAPAVSVDPSSFAPIVIDGVAAFQGVLTLQLSNITAATKPLNVTVFTYEAALGVFSDVNVIVDHADLPTCNRVDAQPTYTLTALQVQLSVDSTGCSTGGSLPVWSIAIIVVGAVGLVVLIALIGRKVAHDRQRAQDTEMNAAFRKKHLEAVQRQT